MARRIKVYIIVNVLTLERIFETCHGDVPVPRVDLLLQVSGIDQDP